MSPAIPPGYRRYDTIILRYINPLQRAIIKQHDGRYEVLGRTFHPASSALYQNINSPHIIGQRGLYIRPLSLLFSENRK